MFQAALITHREILRRPDFEGQAIVVHNLDNERTLARKSPDRVQDVRQSPFSKLPRASQPNRLERAFRLERDTPFTMARTLSSRRVSRLLPK